MTMRTRILLAVVALTLLVAPYRASHGDGSVLALWSLNAHATSIKKAQWAQVYWLKRQALAAERCQPRTPETD